MEEDSHLIVEVDISPAAYGDAVQMSPAGLEIGLHTLSHPYVLPANVGEAARIVSRIERIERDIQRVVERGSLPTEISLAEVIAAAHRSGRINEDSVLSYAVPGRLDSVPRGGLTH